jgi:hypothetical protein
MEAKGGPAFSLADLQGGSKRLNTVPTDTKASKGTSSGAGDCDLDPVLVDTYKDLYNKYDGDLDAM